jgi:hypothetical protein
MTAVLHTREANTKVAQVTEHALALYYAEASKFVTSPSVFLVVPHYKRI